MSRLKQIGIVCKIILPVTAVVTFLIMASTQTAAAASLTPLTSIQTPASGQMLNGTVGGTAVNASGINRVDVYAFDSKGKATSIGTAMVSAATGGNYSTAVNDKTLPAGGYTLVVAGIGNDSQVAWASEPIQIGPAPTTSISSPAGGTTERGAFQLSGTVTNHAGIARVDAYAYNSQGQPIYIGTDSSGSDSYGIQVGANALKAGNYTLAVAGIGKDGDVCWSTTPIQVYPSAVTTVASPTNSAMENGAFTISGQATNHSGIARVDVYAFNNQGKPTYLNSGSVSGTSGGSYGIQVNVASLPAGNYMMAVAGIGNDGDVVWATSSITVGPAATTSIVAPASGAVVTGNSFILSGSVSNHSGISRVDAYAYDSYGKPIYIGTDSGSNGNYSISVDAATLKAGGYTLAVAGIGNDGDVVWATSSITVGPAATTSIVAPASGAIVTGSSFILSGSVSNHSGISRVDAYAYDSYGKPIYIGTDSGSNGNYSISVDAATLKAGGYTLAVAGIGNDGDVVWGTAGVTVGPAASTLIAGPSSGIIESGSFTVSGRAVNHAGISRVDIYAFNSLGKPTYIGTGSVSGANYSVNADVGKLPAGSYTLAVAGIGNDSDVVWATLSLNVGPAPVTTINTLADGAKVSSTIKVEGWALNHAGVGRVDVYLFDGKGSPHPIGTVTGDELQNTTSAQALYPQYSGVLRCDYAVTYNMNQIGAGTYMLAVANIGNDGQVDWVTKTITYAADYVSYNISLSQMEADHPGVDSTALDPTALFNYNSVSKYEFMSLNWVDGVTADDLNNMLNGCGNLAGHGQDFLDAASAYDINPVYLVAHSKLETGNGSTTAYSRLDRGIVFKNGKEYYIDSSGGLSPVYDTNGNQVTGILVSGNTYRYTDSKGRDYYKDITGQHHYNDIADGTYYNLWGIHANDDAPSQNGGIYAGAVGWSSLRTAALGGAKWIAQNYTTGQNYAQNTLYTMKWDPYGWSVGSPYEYATDYNSVTDNWAYDVAQGIQKYASIFGHTAALLFHIPQYSN